MDDDLHWDPVLLKLLFWYPLALPSTLLGSPPHVFGFCTLKASVCLQLVCLQLSGTHGQHFLWLLLSCISCGRPIDFSRGKWQQKPFSPMLAFSMYSDLHSLVFLAGAHRLLQLTISMNPTRGGKCHLARGRCWQERGRIDVGSLLAQL